MGRKSGSGKDENGMSAEDEALWAAFTKDIKAAKGKAGIPAIPIVKDAAHKSAKPVKHKAESTPPAKPVPPQKQPAQLDGKTQTRLERGKLQIEARLDLHGHTQHSAQDALTAFVLRAHKSGKRCVLVITGKGTSKNGEGVLRQKFPHWISLSPLSDIILKSVPAAQKDGGSGAFYLYLKRIR